MTPTKTCSVCKRIKPTSCFHKDASRKDGLCHVCIICKCKKATKYRHTRNGRKIDRKPHNRLRRAIRGQMHKNTENWPTPGISILTYVDWTFDQLVSHLEKLFKPGMTWNNYGKKWHVDHIKPQYKFNMTDPYCEEFKACWALKNLQPLWAHLNLIKGASHFVNREFEEHYDDGWGERT